MKCGVLGAGSWGFCLASVLASNGHEVVCWTTNPDLARQLNRERIHPKFPHHPCRSNMRFTTDIEETLYAAEFLVESVTAAGVRTVFENIKNFQIPSCPIVITSKGIEQNTGLILSDVIAQVLGESRRAQLGYLSGPSFAQEVIRGLPTSIVCSAYDYDVMVAIGVAFSNSSLRVYPNQDVLGVALGGALKNIIALACGAAEGLQLGFSARASLITRGLHEMRKLAVARGCRAETLNGLSGMGDLVLTCTSSLSRNFCFGQLVAQHLTPEEALDKIGMVVEGAYTCTSALQLSQALNVSMPITEAVYQVIYKKLDIKEAVASLMLRPVKEEHL